MDTVTEEIGGEEAASLAALQAQAGQGEPVPGAAQQGPESAAPAVDLGQEISGALLAVFAILRPALPSVAAIYTPEVAGAVGASVAAVCNKHGWLQGGMMGEYAEEFACLATVGPLAFMTYQAAQADIASRKKPVTVEQKTEAAAAVTVDDGQRKAVTFGAQT